MNALHLAGLEQRLTDRDVQILEDLAAFRLLTTRQLQRLHLPAAPYGQHSSTAAATRGTTRILGRLEALGAIARLQRRIGGIKHGSAQTIWHLGAAGERYLRSRDGGTSRKRYLEPGLTFTRHTLAVADVAVTLREHSGAGQFDLLELQAEPACWRPFTGAGSTVLTLKPDLFAVTADTATETHSFIELDRGTEHLPAVLRKCQFYQAYQRTGREQQQREIFPSVTWLVPTPSRQQAVTDAIAADASLDRDLFWITLTENALSLLAPYGGGFTTNRKEESS